jgi:hypothetical protein
MWHLYENNQKHQTTFSTEQLIAHLKANPGDGKLVWKEGLDGWKNPQTLEELQDAFVQGSIDDAQKTAAMPSLKAQGIEPPAQPAPPPSASIPPLKEQAKKVWQGTSVQLKKVRDSESSFAFLPHLSFIDWLLDKVNEWLPTDRMDDLDFQAKKWGHVGLLASGAMVIVLGLIQAIRMKSFMPFLAGIAMALAFLILQYIAIKFLDAGKTIIDKTPSEMSSEAFLDVYSFLTFLSVIVAFFAGPILAISSGDYLLILYFWGGTALGLYVLGLTTSPKTLNIHIGNSTNAGLEAIGIVSFFAKLQLRMIQPLYGVVNLLAPVALLLVAVTVLPFQTSGAIVGAIVGSCLAPVGFYLIFLLYYLLLDVLHAILSIPQKLER